MEFDIEQREVDGVTILDLQGELDTYSSPGLLEMVVKMKLLGRRYIGLNMHLVTYMDVAGLGGLVWSLRCIRGYGGQLVLLQITDQPQRVLDAAGLTKTFTIFATEQEAVQFLAPFVQQEKANA